MKKQIMSIFIITLLLTIGFAVAGKQSTLPIVPLSANETTLQIEIMNRDFDVSYHVFQMFGVHAVLHNRGLINATVVHWSITLQGGLILLGKKASGEVPIMFPDQSMIISIPFVIGFGKTTITVTANASNANTITTTKKGTMNGLTVLILPGSDNAMTVHLEQIAPDSKFKSPVLLTNAGDGSNRLFVVEKTGQINIIKNGVLLDTPFLDISKKLVKLIPFYDERGLLGLAFHPNYTNNGRFFVYYAAPNTNQGYDHQNVIAEYTVSMQNPDVADPASEKIIMRIDAPEFNHVGGQLAFGPDGMLYIGVGDGGGEGDQHGATGNGQNINTSLGKILRIDVDHGSLYAIPSNNPFVGVDGLDEIYAFGFRNPYRFSFDMTTQRLFAADVGQDKWEEVDLVENGHNYGWRIMEGNHLYDPALAQYLQINLSTLTPPIYDYSHYVGHAIIGGYVYRGTISSGLVGKYIFADWSDTYFQPRGKLFYLEETNPGSWQPMEFKLLNDKPLNLYISAIGQDESGELYLIAEKLPGSVIGTGLIWHIVED